MSEGDDGVNVVEWVAALEGSKNWRPQMDEIASMAAAGDVDGLSALAEVLREVDPGGRDARRYVAESFVDTVAVRPGGEFARLSMSIVPRSEKELASRLAFAQSTEVLAELFVEFGDEPRHTSMLARLVQEMVVRGKVLPAVAHEFWDRNVSQTLNPIASLPLEPVVEERYLDCWMPRYAASLSSSSLGSLKKSSPAPEGIAERRSWSVETLSTDRVAAMVSAFDTWTGQSNGKTECAAFLADGVVDELTRSDLLGWPLECTKVAKREETILESVDVAVALGSLFSAASSGGAYDGGVGAAVGRRRAWQSMAGLVGVDADLPLSTICDALNGCRFYSFLSPPGWFYDVAWDVGIVVLQSDRRTAVVLAATDTD